MWIEHYLFPCGAIIDIAYLDVYPDEILLLSGGSSATYNDTTIFRVSTKDGSLKWAQPFDLRHLDWVPRVTSTITMKDLNADGWPEILINSRETGTLKNSLYAYTIPSTPEAI